MDATVTPPWERADALPAKPAEGAWGYLESGQPQPCDLDALRHRVATGEPTLVWSPRGQRLCLPEELPELFDALRERLHRQGRQLMRGSLPWFVLAGFLGWLWRDALVERDVVAVPLFALLCIFGAVPLLQGLWTMRTASRLRPEDLPVMARETRYRLWLESQSAWVTNVLIAAMAGLFVLQWTTGLGRSIDAAGLVKPQVVDAGQWWRLATGTVLHGHLMHLVFNLSAMAALGRMVEVTGGRARLAVVFLASALVGSLASLVYLPQATSVGASGGIVGLIGFGVVMGWRRRHVLPPGYTRSLVLSIVLIATIGLVGRTIIDNAAHAGGLIAGMACGWLLIPGRSTQVPLATSALLRLAGWGAYAVIALTLAGAAGRILRA